MRKATLIQMSQTLCFCYLLPTITNNILCFNKAVCYKNMVISDAFFLLCAPLTPARPAPGTVDQKKPLQSWSSKMYGRMRLRMQVQFRTTCFSFSVGQPDSAACTSFSTA